MLAYLIEMGADIKALDSSSYTALHFVMSTLLPPNIENIKPLERGANHMS
jgi:ankyrin repeat protein